jgi:hypothetical protein
MNTSGNKTTYKPNDISGFKVSDEVYKSATVKVEQSPRKTQELNFNADLIFKTKTVFLLNLADGVKQLFVYNDSLGKEHFYIPTDSGMTLLIYKTYLHTYDNSEMHSQTLGSTNVRKENKTYSGQLAKYLEDCSSIFPKLSAVQYNQNDLIGFFNLYKKSCHPEIVTRKAKKVTVKFGLVAGLSLNSIKFSKSDVYEYWKTSYAYKTNFVAGVNLNVILRGHGEKWSLYNELLFAPYHIEGEYISFINSDRYTSHNTEISVPYVRMNNMIRFKYPLNKFSVFINAGLTTGFGKVKDNYWEKFAKNYAIENRQTGEAIKEVDSFEMGLNAGLGAEYGHFSLNTRWESGDGMSHIMTFKSNTRRFYFLLGYSF